MIPSTVLLVALVVLAAVWYFTRSRRQKKTLTELLNTLHPGELDNLGSYINKETDTLASDIDFWVAFGRYRGLIRKRSNSVCLFQLCQLLCEQSALPPQTLSFISQRSLIVTFLVGCSIPEAIVRAAYSDMPHFCARTVAQLYWEIETRAKILCREYYELNPVVASRVTAILYNSIGNPHASR